MVTPMNLGLLTDIHEHVEFLKVALERFDSEQIDQVVVIGDLFEMGERIAETCRLLEKAAAIGVWGNHDFGLCAEPDAGIRRRYPADVLKFMASLRPRLVVGDCHFSHVEAWLDAENLTDLWYYEGPPDDRSKLERIFAAVPQRVLFAGHFHRWLLATPEGISDWQGSQPVQLDDDERFFVVVGALCQGRYAVFDTETSVLTPYNEASPT